MEVSQYMQALCLNIFEIHTLACVCRDTRDKRLPDAVYIRTTLREQLAWSGGSAAAQEADLAAIDVFFANGYVLAGGRLLAMLHRVYWADSADIDLFRHVTAITRVSEGELVTDYSPHTPAATIDMYTVEQTDTTMATRVRARIAAWRGPTGEVARTLLASVAPPGSPGGRAWDARMSQYTLYESDDPREFAGILSTIFVPMHTAKLALNVTAAYSRDGTARTTRTRKTECESENFPTFIPPVSSSRAWLQHKDHAMHSFDMSILRIGWANLRGDGGHLAAFPDVNGKGRGRVVIHVRGLISQSPRLVEISFNACEQRRQFRNAKYAARGVQFLM